MASTADLRLHFTIVEMPSGTADGRTVRRQSRIQTVRPSACPSDTFERPRRTATSSGSVGDIP